MNVSVAHLEDYRCSPSAYFNAATVSPNRSLIDTPDIEVENAFKIDERLGHRLEGYFARKHLECDISTANSLYHDGDELDLIMSGLSLRDRAGGVTSTGEEHKDMFGLKYRHAELQQAADEVARRLGLNPTSGFYAPFLPYVRAEVERSHRYPRYKSELAVRDLPKDIQKLIKGRLGDKKSRRLVLKPMVNTVVKRKKYEFYLDSAQFTSSANVPFEPVDWEALTLVHEPTEQMKATGKYVCLELSLDHIKYRQPVRGAFIADILASKEKCKQSICRNLKEKQVLEYEFKPKKSGDALTNADLVTAYTGFGLALSSLDRVLGTELVKQNYKKRGREILRQVKPYKSIRSVPSKAVGGYDQLPRCFKNSLLRVLYQAARPFAP